MDIKEFADWIHSQTEDIKDKASDIEQKQNEVKTDDEYIRLLLELSKLTGYAKAMGDCQHKLLEITQRILDEKKKSKN